MNIIKISSLMICLALLSGCVTVTDSRFAKKVNHEKAAETYVALGISYMNAGNLVLARKKIERALKVAPDSAAAHSAMAMYWLERGEFELTEKEFEIANDIDDEHSPTNYHYGYYLMVHKNDDEACDYIAQAALDVDYTARVLAFEGLGLCFGRFGNERQAIDAFERAWSLDMNSTVASLNLANLYIERKRPRIAKRWYQRFESAIKEGGVNQNSASLMTGFKVARASGDKNAAASYAFKLKKRFPESDEYLSFKRGR